jgi:gustatory receptor
MDMIYHRTIGKFFSMETSVRNLKKIDIYSIIIPIYYLSKCAGLAPVSLTYTRDKGMRIRTTLETSTLGIIYTVLLLMVITGAQSCVLIFHHRLPFKVERIHLHVTEVLIMGIASVTSLAISLTRLRKEMDNLLYKVSVLDELFDTECDDQRSNKKYLRIQIISLIIIVSITYTSDFLAFNTGLAAWTLCATTYICNFINIVTITQFVNLIFLLKQKFLILNKFLTSAENLTEHEANGNLWEILLQTSSFRNVINLNHDTLRIDAFYQAITRRYNDNIQNSTSISTQNCWLHKGTLRFRALRVIHDILCDISASVNSMYGLQILLSMVSAFIETTTNMSYSATSMKLDDHTNEDFFYSVLCPMLWALVHFLQLFWITGSCNAASGEADRTVNLLQKLLLLPEIHPATLTEIRLFLQQVNNRKLRFTAWGLFTINRTILGSIVGTIATFLVLLVEIQNAN